MITLRELLLLQLYDCSIVLLLVTIGHIIMCIDMFYRSICVFVYICISRFPRLLHCIDLFNENLYCFKNRESPLQNMDIVLNILLIIFLIEMYALCHGLSETRACSIGCFLANYFKPP